MTAVGLVGKLGLAFSLGQFHVQEPLVKALALHRLTAKVSVATGYLPWKIPAECLSTNMYKQFGVVILATVVSHQVGKGTVQLGPASQKTEEQAGVTWMLIPQSRGPEQK